MKSLPQPHNNFDMHIRDPLPGFQCFACGDRTKKTSLLARVKNQIGRPASAKSLTVIDQLIGEASPALRLFCKHHDGVILYRDTRSDAAGIEFFKAIEWKSRTQEMRESMIAMGFEEGKMPNWIRQGVVFGEIPHSANYFVIQAEGDDAGKVFYADHDDFRTDPIAKTFEKFLKLIVDDPAGFLYDCGCFTRYSDGKTKIQWIPKDYVPNCDN